MDQTKEEIPSPRETNTQEEINTNILKLLEKCEKQDLKIKKIIQDEVSKLQKKEEREDIETELLIQELMETTKKIHRCWKITQQFLVSVHKVPELRKIQNQFNEVQAKIHETPSSLLTREISNVADHMDLTTEALCVIMSNSRKGYLQTKDPIPVQKKKITSFSSERD